MNISEALHARLSRGAGCACCRSAKLAPSPVYRLHSGSCACKPPGGGPRSLRLLLEGESLLNDASSITLFTIFLSEVEHAREGIHQSGGAVLGSILSRTVWLAVGARPRAPDHAAVPAP